MSRHRPLKKDIAELCHAIGPDDGIDPRYLTPSSGRPVGRKQLQLCRQVHEALAATLAGCGDEVLLDLEVVNVVPAAGAGRLLVTLAPSPSAAPRDPATMTAHLAAAQGLLRSETARAVHRRKAPELIVRLVERQG